MKIGLIGDGAIAAHVREAVKARGHVIAATLLRPGKMTRACGLYVSDAACLPGDLDLVIDCAGHEALAQHGPGVLERGMDLLTVSLGALADADLYATLQTAATEGGATLHLASGAIGALDCLQAARTGELDSVTYVGRKSPAGWKSSPAEDALDLETLTAEATHFEGTAREAALRYPKNANVAAAVALAGAGFDATQVRLIADPSVTENIHEVEASGAFGHFHFRVAGNSLPDNPRSSALAAMSVIAKIDQLDARIRF